MTTAAQRVLQLPPTFVASPRPPHGDAVREVSPVDRVVRFPKDPGGLRAERQAPQPKHSDNAAASSRRDPATEPTAAVRNPAYGRPAASAGSSGHSAAFLAQQIAQEVDPYGEPASPGRHNAGHVAYQQAAGQNIFIIGPAGAIGLVI